MNRTVAILLILIVAIAAFLRLWNLYEIPPGLYHDEAMNVNQAREVWRDSDFKIFYQENNGREGLFINIQALSLAAFGATPFATRFPSALFGIFTVLGVFFLTKELFKPASLESGGSYRIALFASFFLATSFWHINFSRIGFRAIMAPFFLVWSFYFLWKLINGLQANCVIATPQSGGSNDNLHSMLYAVIGGLLFGLGFYSYIAYRMAPLLLIIPFFIGWRIYKSSPFSSRHPDISTSRYINISIFRMRSNCLLCLLALFLFFAFIAALPLGVYFLENPADFSGRTAQVSIFSSEMPLSDLLKNIGVTISMFFWRGDYNWRHNFSGAPQLWWPIGILFLIGFSKMIYDLRFTIYESLNLKSYILNPIAGAYLFLSSWFLIFLLPVVLSNEGLPHALRSLPLVIPAVIFAALGLEWLLKNIQLWLMRKKEKYPEAGRQLMRLKKELILLLFVLFAAVAMHGFNQYFLRWSWNPHVYAAFNGSYADLSRYLVALPDGTKKYIIVNTPNHILADDIPMPAQTVMFFTDTWNKQERDRKNFVYIPLLRQDFEGQASLFARLPQSIGDPTIIAVLENDPALRHELKARYPELTSEITEGGLILTNF